MTDDEHRDWLAEQYLIVQHTDTWYIGDASSAEWDAAYRAVDGLLAGGGLVPPYHDALDRWRKEASAVLDAYRRRLR